ncbi:glucose-specific PTS transporter subunit IIBC [Haloplasma contractile]|uniref:PTS system glucose-specific EIICBA component protein n=1 Tax=Haloplasma contractile SSD-17B TaxID=1033810 RepID=U2EEG7_9MOLU|nr:glucose-specific PTS transporter subunit IIBC [Haloplasma contractile]ERJ13091.1 PTS system glucose-specific EIICBA component protein [Haloplasma contractile SSD-17B]
MFKKMFGWFQKVGKALMLPVAILPVAGILLGVGSSIQEEHIINILPFLENEQIQLFAEVMKKSGQIIFENLPLLFAVGVAVGLTGGSGVAALAAIVGYLIMNQTISIFSGITIEMVLEQDDPSYILALGIPTLQTGVLGGIIIGGVAATMFNRFYDIKLPPYLGFFAGKRFVPIVTAGACLILGIFMSFIWPSVQTGLDLFSRNLVNYNLTLSAFIFGVFERALIPFGLHHIFYSPFWFEFGEYVNNAGEVIRGDQRIFFEQLVDGVPITAGTFMTGKYPFMMFGLPAAALAMYHEARKEKKKLVGGLMISGALTSFLTGITEPIEFTFLFVAPILFFVHVLFAGLSFMLMHMLNVKIGMTFSGGLIDFVLFGVIQNRTSWWLVLVVGLFFAIIYYFGFRFAIRVFDIKTPGRETDDEKGNETTVISINKDEMVESIIDAIGGEKNIKSLDSCITRLRIQVYEVSKVKKDQLKQLGASGVLIIGDSVQAIFGTYSEQIKTRMLKSIEMKNTDFNKFQKEKNFFVSPMGGEIISLSDVPDSIFSSGMMGDGFAIIPKDGKIVSPVEGVISSFYPTKHAIGIKSKVGPEVLIHFGIDTVHLRGKGFTAHVNKGDSVEIGQLLLEVDLATIKNDITSTITPIIISKLSSDKINVTKGICVGQGSILFEL